VGWRTSKLVAGIYTIGVCFGSPERDRIDIEYFWGKAIFKVGTWAQSQYFDCIASYISTKQLGHGS
jgi:hypothetical protein